MRKIKLMMGILSIVTVCTFCGCGNRLDNSTASGNVVNVQDSGETGDSNLGEVMANEGTLYKYAYKLSGSKTYEINDYSDSRDFESVMSYFTYTYGYQYSLNGDILTVYTTDKNESEVSYATVVLDFGSITNTVLRNFPDIKGVEFKNMENQYFVPDSTWRNSFKDELPESEAFDAPFTEFNDDWITSEMGYCDLYQSNLGGYRN